MKKQRKRNKSFKLIIIIFLLILSVFFIDKYTGNNLKNILIGKSNSQIISKNKESLIISAYVEKDYLATIPILSYNEIEIDWGDGVKEKFISKKQNIKKEDNIYSSLILPRHQYSKKDKYNIIITGDTKRGLFGQADFSISDNFGKNMFKKEFLDKVSEYNKGKSEVLDKYIELSKSDLNKVEVYNIINFKNLNFKGLGQLTTYFSGDIPTSWINEFSNIEAFIETFENSNIRKIPSNIFENSNNLRILSGTFLACDKLGSIPENLIKNLDKIENVRYCFANAHNIKGKAPEWWKTMTKIKDSKITNELPFLLCFNECTKLENYNEIPPFWGGINKI